MGKIALYTGNQEKERQICELAALQHIGFLRIRPSDFSCSIASILQKRPKPVQNAVRIPPLYTQPELLVFSGLSEKELDRFLAAYRTRHIAPIALKAVVTPFNCMWSVYELTKELTKEKKAIDGQAL